MINKNEQKEIDLAKIANLCKRRGFIFQSSEIFGGLSSVWDYGPLGVELKKNIKDEWWKRNIYQRNDIEGLDASILMNQDVWKASGHLTNFADLLVDCKKCKKRFRSDKLDKPNCPDCGGELTQPRKFNLMFKTGTSSVEGQGQDIYLRPETAQGIFVNFSNVLTSSRRKLPFGIAQIGKAFRNEITTGNFTFRSREFEQMEIEYFVDPDQADKSYEYWLHERLNWYLDLGISKDNLKLRQHKKDELAHYARNCHDIEYLFPFGWSELEGIANRGDYDLRQHAKASGKELCYFDAAKKEKVVPYVIEPSGGVDRAFLAFLIDSYNEEKVKSEKRVFLKLHKKLAPIKAAVLPLLKNRPEIIETAKRLHKDIMSSYKVGYDDTASIGRLYRRQDEIGTLYCVTVDVQSLDDKKVTVRDRDTMQQVRIDMSNLKNYLDDNLKQ